MNVWTNHTMRVVLLGVAAMALASCSDVPTEQNAPTSPSLPLPVIIVRDTVITATTGKSYRQYLAMDERYDLIGQENGRTAHAALQFYPSSFPVRDTIVVVSARLKLRMATWAGTPGGQLAFTVHKIQKAWLSYTMTWDTLQSGFYESNVLGSYNGFGGADTQLVTVDIDTGVVRQWLSSSADVTRFGLMLLADPSSTVLRGFHAFATDSTAWYPTLEVIARNVAATTLDTANYSSGMDTFVGNIDNLATDPNLLYLQAGVVYRSSLNFDVSFIPRGATLNIAELQLERDSTTSRLNAFSGDSTFAAHNITLVGDPPGFEVNGATGAHKTGTTTTYAANVTGAVQTWLRGINNGLVLRMGATQEYSSVDLLAFHGPTASNLSQRPRIRIVYSWRAQ